MATKATATAGAAKQTITITEVVVTRIKGLSDEDNVQIDVSYACTGTAWNASAHVNDHKLYSWSTSGSNTFQDINKKGTYSFTITDSERSEHTDTFPFRCYVQYQRSTTGDTGSGTYTFTIPAYGASASIKVNGEWLESDAVLIKVNGAWISADAIYTKVNGEWLTV